MYKQAVYPTSTSPIFLTTYPRTTIGASWTSSSKVGGGGASGPGGPHCLLILTALKNTIASVRNFTDSFIVFACLLDLVMRWQLNLQSCMRSSVVIRSSTDKNCMLFILLPFYVLVCYILVKVNTSKQYTTGWRRGVLWGKQGLENLYRTFAK